MNIDPSSKENLIRKLARDRKALNRPKGERGSTLPTEERKVQPSNVHVRSEEENKEVAQNLVEMQKARKVREGRRKKEKRARMSQQEQREEVSLIFNDLTDYQRVLMTEEIYNAPQFEDMIKIRVKKYLNQQKEKKHDRDASINKKD